jgi:hypothetical protein
MRPHHLVYALLCTAGLTLPFAAASAAHANVVINVNKSTQHMLVTVDGVTRYDFPVSTGRAGFGTPSGTFHPNRMDPMHYSKEYENAPMPDSIFFDLHGHAIHGFTHTPFGIAAVSHGCVRMPVADAATLFQLVKSEGMANTTVIISGHIPRAPLMARRGTQAQEASNQPPTAITPYAQPGYGQQGYGQDYGQDYGHGYGYGPQPYARRREDRWGRQEFPPQPAPTYSYGRRTYARPYGGQTYYTEPYGYERPQYRGLFSGD